MDKKSADAFEKQTVVVRERRADEQDANNNTQNDTTEVKLKKTALRCQR